MCTFIEKFKERSLWKLSKSEILRLYSIAHVAMETTKTSNFPCQSKSFISIFFTCQVSACELQPFSCHNFANDIYSQTAKTVFSHLKWKYRITLLHDKEQVPLAGVVTKLCNFFFNFSTMKIKRRLIFFLSDRLNSL